MRKRFKSQDATEGMEAIRGPPTDDYRLSREFERAFAYCDWFVMNASSKYIFCKNNNEEEEEEEEELEREIRNRDNGNRGDNNNDRDSAYDEPEGSGNTVGRGNSIEDALLQSNRIKPCTFDPDIYSGREDFPQYAELVGDRDSYLGVFTYRAAVYEGGFNMQHYVVAFHKFALEQRPGIQLGRVKCILKDMFSEYIQKEKSVTGNGGVSKCELVIDGHYEKIYEAYEASSAL